MTENDEQLLMRFFDELKQDIDDNGFTEGVMRQLPAKTLRMSRWWTMICWVIGIVFFFIVDGVGQLRRILIAFLGDVVGMLSTIHLPISTIVMASIVILTLLAIEVYRLAEEY